MITRRFVANAEGDEHSSEHLFVSGPYRAGTTLLELSLSGHPTILISPESTLVGRLIRARLAPDRRLTANEIGKVAGLVRVDEKLQGWPGFSPAQFLDRLDSANDLTVATLLDILFAEFAFCMGRRPSLLGNKKGDYANGYGPYVKALFPDARFIFIVRDPRDVVLSAMANLHVSARSAIGACRWRHKCIEEMRDQFPNDVYLVKYEDLVRCPRQACLSICDFLGLAFDDGMLRFHETNQHGGRLITGTRDTIHYNTTRKFDARLAFQWQHRHDIPRELIRSIERGTAGYMAQYGYEASDQVSKVARVWASASSRLSLMVREGRVRLEAVKPGVLGGWIR